jgi:1-acyl-sn-glycerol-3-phosphate acyltransferase
MSVMRKTIMRLFGEKNCLGSAMGGGANVYALSLALVDFAMHTGLREFMAKQSAYARSKDLIDVRENYFLELAKRHFLHGIDVYAKALALDVIFEGRENVPDQGIVFYLAANHASIFSDFLFSWLDPAAAPVADVENTNFNRAARKVGAALYFDLLGLPFIKRPGAEGEDDRHARMSSADALSKRLTELVAIHGVRPIFFGQGGRVPTAYDDHGNQARAGFYSNAPDPKKPDVYFQAGGVIAAAAKLARQSGRPVSLGLVSLRGSEMIMPKDVAPSFPFFAPARSGQTITYRIVDVVKIEPFQKGLSKLAKRAVEALKRDLEIDPYLESVVATWAQDAGKERLGDAFAETAQKDERFYIIADRLRSIHPRYPERRHFKARLLNTVGARGGASEEEIRKLLAAVTRTAKRYEYGRVR